MKDNNTQNSAMLDAGNWVPVDASSLGFDVNARPGQIIAGPDGHYYRVNKPEPTYTGVASNAQNAIPTPSSIVQMPPIVQPIALVPYTSQNQPLLQYDPYARPAEPNVQTASPQYVKKAYKGISLAAMFSALAAILAMLILSVGMFRQTTLRESFSFSGIDAVKSILALLGVGSFSSDYYTYRIEGIKNSANADFFSKFVAYGLPIIVIVMMVIFALLVIKYLIKLVSNKSPRSFSVLALINIILTITIMLMLLSITNDEIASSQRSDNIQKFLAFKSSVYMGIGLIISLVASIVLFILPFLSRKNAYVLENSNKTFIMNQQ